VACCINPLPGGPGDFLSICSSSSPDTPVPNCKAAVLVLVRSGYFISPVPAISGETPDGRLATPHGRAEEIRGLMGEKGLTEEGWNDGSNWRKRII